MKISAEVMCPTCEDEFTITAEGIADKVEIPKALPIFFNAKHTMDNLLGTIYFEDGAMIVTLHDGLSIDEEDVFECFGDVSFEPLVKLKDGKKEKYSSFRILAYNLRKK